MESKASPNQRRKFSGEKLRVSVGTRVTATKLLDLVRVVSDLECAPATQHNEQGSHKEISSKKAGKFEVPESFVDNSSEFVENASHYIIRGSLTL